MPELVTDEDEDWQQCERENSEILDWKENIYLSESDNETETFSDESQEQFETDTETILRENNQNFENKQIFELVK